jgi:hypothetical protein
LFTFLIHSTVEKLKKQYPVVSVFRNVTDTTPFDQKPLDQVLMQIHNCVECSIIDPCRKLYRDGNIEAYTEKKKSLKCFTASGMFEAGRKAENLQQYSGFIILDIDKLPEEQIKPLKELICKMPLTFCCFISPSGAGLKILVQVSSKAEQHTQAFNQLKAIYEKELCVEIDKSGKDINRLCFYSSDREIYVNEDARIFTPQHEQPKQHTKPQHNTFNTALISADVFEKCVQLTENIYRFQEGQRNNFVHLLANNCNRNGIPEHEAESRIKAQYNYNEAEVSAAIKSAYNNGRNEFAKFAPRHNTPIAPPSYSHKGVVGLADLIRRHNQEPPVPFIWSGIKKNSFGFVFGPSKSGKTTFCENLAMCLAAQLQSFFGQPITPDNYKVLFISLEEYWQARTERNKKQVIPLIENLGTDDWLANYDVINENVPRQIASDADWLEIERMIVNSKANVVFIDSLSRLYEGGIEDSGLAKKVALLLRELTNKLKITLIVIHHTPKQIGKPITQDSLAGSRMLGQEADFLIGIGKNLEGKRYFKEVSFRYRQEQQENVTVFDIDGYQWLIAGAELPEAALLKEPDGRKDDTNPEQVYEFIHDKTLSPQGETYTRELIAEFVTIAVMSKQTLYNCLDRLEKSDRISKKGKGVYKSVSE